MLSKYKRFLVESILTDFNLVIYLRLIFRDVYTSHLSFRCLQRRRACNGKHLKIKCGECTRMEEFNWRVFFCVSKALDPRYLATLNSGMTQFVEHPRFRSFFVQLSKVYYFNSYYSKQRTTRKLKI